MMLPSDIVLIEDKKFKKCVIYICVPPWFRAWRVKFCRANGRAPFHERRAVLIYHTSRQSVKAFVEHLA